MMRILQLCTKVPYPPKDGGAAGVFVYTKAFSALGHSVDILAVNPPKHFIREEQYQSLPENVRIYPVVIDTTLVWHQAMRNLLFSSLPYQVERFSNNDFAIRLSEILSKTTYDVVQIEGVYLCPYITVIRTHSKAKVILRAHNIEGALWKNIARNETNLLKRIYLGILAQRMRRYEIRQFSQVDAITTVTTQDLEYVKKYQSNHPAAFFPYAIEINSLPDISTNRKDLYFLGALDWMPNQEAILWFATVVWPGIYQKFPDIRFHIAGRNAPASLVGVLKGIEGVKFYGEIPDAVAFSRQFRVMVSPLFSGSGIRVKIIEAMQHGVVVIASAKAVEGIPAVSGQHLLLAETARDYIDQLGRLFSEPGLMEIIAANARQLVCEKFDILAITRNLIEFYNVHRD